MPTTHHTLVCPTPGAYDPNYVELLVESWPRRAEVQNDPRGTIWEADVQIGCGMPNRYLSTWSVEPLALPEPAWLLWGVLLVAGLKRKKRPPTRRPRGVEMRARRVGETEAAPALSPSADQCENRVLLRGYRDVARLISPAPERQAAASLSTASSE